MARKKRGNPIHGWINFDKPAGMTSMQAIARVRRILNAEKIGHAGTLDPMATGVLPIALGEATKAIHFMQDANKQYRFTVSWGQERNTDDEEGEVTQISEKRPQRSEIEAIIPRFIGAIQQVPPQFSAIKIDGKRAYAMARAGETADIKSREVTVYSIQIIEHMNESDKTTFVMDCSKGTYVRAVARDMGRILGCFGYISMLRRTKVGYFEEINSFLLENLEKMAHCADVEKLLLPVMTVLGDIPALALGAEEAGRLKSGQSLSFISKQDFARLDGFDEGIQTLAIFGDIPIAVVEIQKAVVRPIRVLNINP